MANVLIIDDDQDVSRLLRSHFTDEGHQVFVAHHGEEGVAQAQKLVPDLIMLDVFLPDATGFQVCNQLRKNATTRTIPIIMMTGAARFPNQQMYGRERGANEYIFKPFNIMEVAELVHKYISPTGQEQPAAAPAIQAAAPMKLETISPSMFVELGSKETREDENLPQPLAQNAGQEDQIKALSSFLEQSLSKGGSNGHVKLDSKGRPVMTPIEPVDLPMVEKPEPAKAHPKKNVSAPAEETPLPASPGKDRFIGFTVEIFGLATRLSGTLAEKYLAEQLLRCAMSLGWRMEESEEAGDAAESVRLLQSALKDLRETGYWLALTRQIGLLQTLSKSDLEKTCQALISALNHRLEAEKTHASRQS